MLVNTSVSMRIKKAWLPCWSQYNQQVSHQRWIWGSHRQKVHKKGIYPGIETQGRCHQKSKTGVSMAPRKGLRSSKFFFKEIKKERKEQKCPTNPKFRICSCHWKLMTLLFYVATSPLTYNGMNLSHQWTIIMHRSTTTAIWQWHTSGYVKIIHLFNVLK